MFHKVSVLIYLVVQEAYSKGFSNHYLSVWSGYEGCDVSTTPQLSPFIFLPQNQWIDMGWRGFPYLYVSWSYVSNLSSIRWGNPKLLVHHYKVPNLGINGGECKLSKCSLIFFIQLFGDSLVYLHLSSSIYPSIFNPMSLIRAI